MFISYMNICLRWTIYLPYHP